MGKSLHLWTSLLSLRLSVLDSKFAYPLGYSRCPPTQAASVFRGMDCLAKLQQPPHVLDQITNNKACPTCITAAAGTSLPQGYLVQASLWLLDHSGA